MHISAAVFISIAAIFVFLQWRRHRRETRGLRRHIEETARRADAVKAAAKPSTPEKGAE